MVIDYVLLHFFFTIFPVVYIPYTKSARICVLTELIGVYLRNLSCFIIVQNCELVHHFKTWRCLCSQWGNYVGTQTFMEMAYLWYHSVFQLVPHFWQCQNPVGLWLLHSISMKELLPHFSLTGVIYIMCMATGSSQLFPITHLRYSTAFQHLVARIQRTMDNNCARFLHVKVWGHLLKFPYPSPIHIILALCANWASVYHHHLWQVTAHNNAQTRRLVIRWAISVVVKCG